MTSSCGVIVRLAEDLRAIISGTTDPRAILERVRPLVRELALSRVWLEQRHYECHPEQGFGVHLLHEEPDHTLAVFAGAWLPGRGAPPHNHGTWAVMGGVIGAERNTLWTRVDNLTRPGYAELRRREDRVLGPGDVLVLQPNDIHSVMNDTEAITVSLHVYGKHVNHTERSQFDPERRTEQPFVVSVHSHETAGDARR